MLTPEPAGESRRKNSVRPWIYPALWVIFQFIVSTDLGSERMTHGLLFRLLGSVWPGVYLLSPSAQHLIEFGLRKAAHFTEYAVLGCLLLRALLETGFSRRSAVRWAWLVLAVCASLDEFHQSFVPSRTPTPKDVFIDVIGGVFGTLAYLTLRRVRENRKSEDY